MYEIAESESHKIIQLFLLQLQKIVWLIMQDRLEAAYGY